MKNSIGGIRFRTNPLHHPAILCSALSFHHHHALDFTVEFLYMEETTIPSIKSNMKLKGVLLLSIFQMAALVTYFAIAQRPVAIMEEKKK